MLITGDWNFVNAMIIHYFIYVWKIYLLHCLILTLSISMCLSHLLCTIAFFLAMVPLPFFLSHPQTYSFHLSHPLIYSIDMCFVLCSNFKLVLQLKNGVQFHIDKGSMILSYTSWTIKHGIVPILKCFQLSDLSWLYLLFPILQNLMQQWSAYRI